MTLSSWIAAIDECFEDFDICMGAGSIASSVGALFLSDQPLEYSPYSLLEMFEGEKRASTGGACTGQYKAAEKFASTTAKLINSEYRRL